ncbi:MAG: hypothetical protein U9R14_02660 [Patescibacteria group bacterium]|nr:hypothetical protein [Patescibacteria group bacterium]
MSAKPRILLLDEPFKSIDINTAASLREELEFLLKKVSHIIFQNKIFILQER